METTTLNISYQSGAFDCTQPHGPPDSPAPLDIGTTHYKIESRSHSCLPHLEQTKRQREKEMPQFNNSQHSLQYSLKCDCYTVTCQHAHLCDCFCHQLVPCGNRLLSNTLYGLILILSPVV